MQTLRKPVSVPLTLVLLFLTLACSQATAAVPTATPKPNLQSNEVKGLVQAELTRQCRMTKSDRDALRFCLFDAQLPETATARYLGEARWTVSTGFATWIVDERTGKVNAG